MRLSIHDRSGFILVCIAALAAGLCIGTLKARHDRPATAVQADGGGR